MKVYFIQSGPGGAVKIGKARDPHKRMIELQVGNPKKLRLLHEIDCGTCSAADRMEKRIHDRLRTKNSKGKTGKHHIRGEWYKPSILRLLTPLLS